MAQQQHHPTSTPPALAAAASRWFSESTLCVSTCAHVCVYACAHRLKTYSKCWPRAIGAAADIGPQPQK